MPEKEPKINKKRIFCVITQGELGGAQQFVAQLANHLDREKFDLHIVWGAESGSALARLLPAHVTYAAAEHLVRSLAPLSDLRAIGELRRMMTDYRPDTVLCISSKAGFVGARAAHGLRAQFPHMKVVYRIGGWTFNDPWTPTKRRLYLELERLSARWKDVIVVNNTHDLEQAKALGITPRGQLLRIYNGIDPYLDFLPRDQARLELAGRVPDRYQGVRYDWLVGTIANHYPAKDLGTFVRAAARVSPNVRFVIIGNGPERKALERLIADYDLEERFFLVGSLHNAYRYLPAFDAFVLPSVKEGFPWSVLEAMAAKVPVIATRVGAIPEMIELLENDRLRQDLAIRAHQQLISKFSLLDMIAQYERLLS
jgi:glycosyltransferase involved in cell wall biosynthesis